MSRTLANALEEAKVIFRKKWSKLAEFENFHYEVSNFDHATHQRHAILWEQLLEALETGCLDKYLANIENEGRLQARAYTRLEGLLNQLTALINLLAEVVSTSKALQAEPFLLKDFTTKLNRIRSQAQIAIMRGFAEENCLMEQERAAESLAERQRRFENLAVADLIKMVPAFHIVRYHQRQLLFSPGLEDSKSKLYFVISGQIRLFQDLPDGRAITLALLGSNAVFAYTNRPNTYFRDVYAEAMKDSTVAYIGENSLDTLMEQAPLLASRIIQSFSEQLSQSQYLIEGLIGRDVSMRLANLLLKLADEFGTAQNNRQNIQIDLELTHQQLADMIGCNRVTVTRKLGELQQQKIVVIEKNRTISILNKKALQELLAAS